MSPVPRARILVVEDDAGMARLQQKRLERAGHSVAVAQAAEAALKTIADEGADLMLIDYRLSGRQTGLEFFLDLKAGGYDLPTILVTGFSNETLVIEALRAGIRDFVTKSPEYIEYLPEAVDRTLSQVRLERKLAESQAQMKGILDSAMDAILTVDERFRVEFCNRAAEAMFGCSAAELAGQDINQFILPPAEAAPGWGAAKLQTGSGLQSHTDISAGPRNGDAPAALFQRAALGPGPGSEGTVFGVRSARGRKKTGALFPLEVQISHGAAPGRTFFTIVARDMTEHNRMLEEMLRSGAEAAQASALRELAETRARLLSELEAANKELEAFSYSVSHDLRAPLRAIDGFTRILLNQHSAGLAPEALELLGDVRANAAEMGRLIDDLLSFARLSRQPLEKKPVDSRALVNECLASLRSEQEDRPVEVRVAELPACLADRGLLKQVWMNLISNALKYTARCQRAVIEIGAREAPDGEVVYFVKDNGVGFDMRYAAKLFGVFQRLHRAEDYPGTGVGLATVQRIIHRHGGRVWAESEPGQGALFCFTIAEPGTDG